MNRTLLAAMIAAALLAAPDDTWAKKKDGPYGPPPYGPEEFIPPGQAKPKGPPPWAPAHGYRAKQAYRYYPGANIYQDPATGIFFSLQGGSWVRGLPPGVDPARLGRYHEFEGYKDEPWKNNPYKKGKK